MKFNVFTCDFFVLGIISLIVDITENGQRDW